MNASSSTARPPATSTPAGRASGSRSRLTQIYGETEDHGFPDLTPAQVAYATDLAGSWGVPGAFTFRSDTLLPPSDAWNALGHGTDGKGIDHFFDVYGERIVGALFAALQNA